MHSVLRREQRSPYWNQVPSYFIRLCTGSRGDPYRWIEPHRLREDLGGIGQTLVVGGGRRSILKHRHCFLMQPILNVGVMRQKLQREGECVGGRLMPGEDDGDALVVELLVRHRVR